MNIFRSIKTRLLVFILCISLIPIAAITTIYYLNARKVLKEHTFTWMKEIAEARRNHVLAFMDAKKGRTVDFSSDGFIRDSLEKINNNEEKQETAINLSRHLSVNKKPLGPYIISIAVVNLRGKVVASTDKNWIGEDISNREVFTQAVKDKNHNRAYVVGPHYIPEFDTKCISIHAYLTSKDSGKPIGLILNIYDLAVLSDITARRTGMSKTGEVYIVDSNKMMITESRFIENAPLEVMVDTEPVRKVINSGEEMVGIYTDYRGVSIVGASVYMPENGWMLLSEIDKSEAFAPLRFLGIVALSVGAISATLVTVLGVFFAVSTSRPIKLLTGAAEQFADGNLDYRAKINQQDEIGQLADSFYRMAEKLKKSGSVIQKSEERFRELAENIPSVFWVATPDFNRITYASPAYEIVWGRTCKSLYEHPKSWRDSIHPDDRDRVTAALEDHIQDKAVFEEEYRIVRPDGSTHWIRDRAFSIKTGPGTTDHIIGIAEDITERKNTEERLKETTVELKDKNENLERFHSVTVDRELEMVRLKEEVNSLHESAGLPGKYEAPEKVKEVTEK